MSSTSKLKHQFKILLVALYDLGAAYLALLGAVIVRFSGQDLPQTLQHFWPFLPWFGLVSLSVFAIFSLYRGKWRLASIVDLAQIVKASTTLALLGLVAEYFLLTSGQGVDPIIGKKLLFTYWIFQIATLSAGRFALRYIRYINANKGLRHEGVANVVVLARASEADAILRAAEMNALSLIYVRAILSPLASDVNKFVRDIRISGGITDLERVVNQLRGRGLNVDRVLVAPSVLRDVPAADLLQITRRIGVPLWRTLDSDLVSDSASMAPLDERTILSRPARRIDYEALSTFITGQKAMVVGGGGSIGGELVRRLATFAPSEIIIVEHAEPALDAILEELQASHFGQKTQGVLADIRDRDRMFEIMAEHKPSLVIHAAALKHVNHLEVNWTEGIKTNVFGSVNVFEAAVAAGVPRVVFISTDKAVKPVSILGATKRFGELYARALDSEQSGTRFISVRFGNVLNSSGSAVPKFRAQIARRQPVTVTHPDMERYFISNREAGELVLTAALCSSRNDVPEMADASLFVLDMGSPVRILDLAEALIRLEGLEPGTDIPIKFTGLRPGERLFEIVNEDTEAAHETPYDGVLALVDSAPHPAILRRLLDGLSQAIKAHDREQAQSILQRGVPGYVPMRSQGG